MTAWKEGFAISGTSLNQFPLDLALRRLPERDHEEYQWTDPLPDKARKHNCGNCHEEIYREWSSGAHARSSRNPRLLNLLEGVDARGRRSRLWSVADEHPLGAAICSLCHAPTFTSDPVRNDVGKAKGDSGVHCDYCHKVVDVEADGSGALLGRDALKLLRPKDDRQLFFGPLDDALREGETFGHSPIYKDSRYCAACHEGVVFGVHAYGTYSEWRESPAYRQNLHCQDCHMKPTGTMRNIAPGKGGINRDPRTLASHVFPGGDAAMLGRSVKVDVRWDKGRSVHVTVRAEGVGHRVPTGFVDRHLILVVEAIGKGDAALPLTDGHVLPAAAGSGLTRKPGKLFAKLLLDEDGNGPLPFWRLPERMSDTRLVPGRGDTIRFEFTDPPRRVRVRLIYRRFWREVIEQKGWEEDDLILMDRAWSSD
jgi:hypothetical protein